MFFLQLLTNLFLFLLSILGLIFNKQSILMSLICIELMLLSLNLNFIIFSVYLDDIFGQIFSIFILTVAAAESSIGLAIIISFYRVRGNVSLVNSKVLKN
jgi:NADH-quinone oxidoreductase subunit K